MALGSIEQLISPEMQGTLRRSARLREMEQAKAIKKASPTNEYNNGPQKTSRNRKRVNPVVQTRKGQAILHWTQHSHWPSDLAEPIVMDQVNKLRLTRTSSTPQKTTADSGGRKTHAYSNPRCLRFLNACGTFLFDHKEGPMADDKIFYEWLFSKKFETPKDTMFEEHSFGYICSRMTTRNETAVMQMVHRLLIPSAEVAVHRGHIEFTHLIDSINERWDGSNSLDEPAQLPASRNLQYRLPRPQPDYAVGFSAEAFTLEQTQKLQAHIGGMNDTSFFKGTCDMLFPFFAAEAKAFAGAMQSAASSNAHSTTIAMRGVIELFKLVKREKELHRKIIAFSIYHDSGSVIIYGHYPVIIGERVEYFRHTIDQFSLTVRNGERRWTTYNFVMAIYDSWVPLHFKLVCSAVNDLPKINFDLTSSPPLSRHDAI